MKVFNLSLFMRSILIILLFTLEPFSKQTFAIEDSCDCPSVSCSNPCEENKGVSFYTEKCNGGKSVKSCVKQKCVPMTQKTPACLAFETQNQQHSRLPASEPNTKESIEEFKQSEVFKAEIAKVSFLEGKAWLKLSNGEKKEVVLKMSLHEGDILLTDESSKVQVSFNSGNIIYVLPKSELKLTQVEESKREKKVLLDLILGKVRSKVKQKYKGAEYYRVRTRSAVAGVRGTDFVVSYSQDQKSITQVQTFRGTVEFKSKGGKHKSMVHKGEEVSFVVAANSTEVFSQDEINNFVDKGYMTSVYQMNEKEIKKLDRATSLAWDNAVDKSLAKKQGPSLCELPNGEMNQCAWTCQNNPKGEKACRTDLKNVSCIRKRCNANGEWSEDTRLPASFFGQCQPRGIKVAPCDY